MPRVASLTPPQSWIGKPRFLLDGVVYRYEVGNENEMGWTKPKSVPADKVVAYIEGCWMKQIRYKLKGEKASLAHSWHETALTRRIGLENTLGCRLHGPDTKASERLEHAGRAGV